MNRDQKIVVKTKRVLLMRSHNILQVYFRLFDFRIPTQLTFIAVKVHIDFFFMGQISRLSNFSIISSEL